ncbi:MAG: hypothetical protein R6X22_05920 [Gemmatimonadota bacterium]
MPRILALLALCLPVAACWRIGEPTESAALITWAAYPDTVVAGEIFPLEVAGPVASDACGRLDTVTVEVAGGEILVGARRSVYDTMCSDSPVGFYEARALRLPTAGEWLVRTREGRVLGSLVAVDSGRFSGMRAVGEGTVVEAGGCMLFAPGRIGNQRPFALRGAPTEFRMHAGTDRRVRVEGRLGGFTLCGAWGSRPVIVVHEGHVTDSTAEQYYEGRDRGADGNGSAMRPDSTRAAREARR